MEEVMDKAVKAVREASRREFEEYIKHQEKENEKTRALLRELNVIGFPLISRLLRLKLTRRVPPLPGWRVELMISK
ncbi:hypothetical protein PR003_g6642 [Phytophthora rubi]|uniref:Uncharacterized protein n=1 Tax=Phytophthora rubi TaxID=129364 RepID=A0A6A4FG98_9STRA|nr:hypothetical protein PR003_g6642 [Phytophthora rubi]